MKRFLSLLILVTILLTFAVNVEANPSKESMILKEKSRVLDLYSDVYEYLEYCISLRNKDFNIAMDLISLNISDIGIGFDIEKNNIAVFNIQNPTDYLLITERFVVKEIFEKYNNIIFNGNSLINGRAITVAGFVIVATTVAILGKVLLDSKTVRDVVKAWIENKIPDDGIFIDCTKFELKIKDIFEIKYEKNIHLKQAGEDGSPIPGGEEKIETIEYTEQEEENRIEYEILKEEKPAPWELIPAS